MDARKIELLLKKLSAVLDTWAQCSVRGKRILADIIATHYPMAGPCQSDGHLAASLQTLTDNLAGELADMVTVLATVDDTVEKLRSVEQLIGLKQTSPGAGDDMSVEAKAWQIQGNYVKLENIVEWISTIHKNYTAQLTVNRLVLDGVCHLETREQALFYQAAWTLQPEITSDSELFVSCIRQITSSTSVMNNTSQIIKANISASSKSSPTVAAKKQ